MFSMMTRLSNASDLDAMVELSRSKRRSYEKAQPQFWGYAGAEGDRAQRAWFETLLSDPQYLLVTAVDANNNVMPPAVYTPGLTLMIDDFCVAEARLWESVGGRLVDAITTLAKAQGAVQVVVVCGAHDAAKQQFLKSQSLTVASEWYVGSLR